MKAYVVRPVVVLALVAAMWLHVPAATAEKGGRDPGTKQGRGGTFNAHITRANRNQVFTSTETDLVSGVVQVFEFAQEYDNRGLLVHESRTQSEDGHVTSSTETSFTYGSAHRLSLVVTVDDPDGEGPVPPSTRVDTLTRNSKHNLISIVTTVDDESDGVVDSTSTENRSFDKRGRVISTRVEDGGLVTTTSFTYDSHGNILAETTDEDDLSTPQSPDFRSTSTSTYDEPHSFVTQQSDQAFSFDSQGKAQLLNASTTTYARTNQGLISGSTFTADSDGDGQVDITGTSTSTYDKQGNLLSESGSTDDGTDVFGFSQVLTNDAKGYPVKEVAEETLNGVVTFHSEDVNTLDKFGRLTKSITSADTDGDGTLDFIETFTQTYDNKSRSTGWVDSFTDGNGVLTYRETHTIVYGKFTSTDTEQIDSDGDGTVDRTVVQVTPL